MGAVQKRIAQVSLAKQSAKGSPAANGTYQIGVMSGQVVEVNVDEAEIPVTWSGRVVEAYDRVAAVPGMEFSVVAMPKSIGLLLFAACGADTVTGTSPKLHTIKTGTSLPYLSIFSTYGGEFYLVSDAKIDTLELSWDRVGALTAKVKLVGCGLVFEGSADVPTNTERPAAGVLKGSGGTFQIDGADAVIKSGSITISNSVVPVQGSASVNPADVFEGEQTVTVSLTVVPSDTTLWRKALTGTTGGSTVSAAVATGTAEMKWILDGNNDLDCLINAMKFACPYPDADPGGGPAEIVLEGQAFVKSDGTTPYQFTLHNSVASY